MAQGQRGNGTVAPDTLPADFFDGQQGAPAPDTLPGGFFDKQSPATAAPPPVQAAQQPPPARLTAAPVDTSGMTLGDVAQLQQRLGRPLNVSGGPAGTVRPAPINPGTLISIPTLTSPIAEALGAERVLPALARLGVKQGLIGAGSALGTGVSTLTHKYLPESWQPYVDETLGMAGGLGAMLLGGQIMPEPQPPTLTPKEIAAIGDVSKAPSEPARFGPITEAGAVEQQRAAEAASRAKSYRPGKPLGTIEPTEAGQRPSPSRESIFPGGTYRGGPASAQVPTTVPITPMEVPKGGVGASIQTATPPVETPVAPPRAFPSQERMFPGGYRGRPASAGYPTTDVSVTRTPQRGAGVAGPARTTEPGFGGRIGSAGDPTNWSREDRWAAYMQEYQKLQRGEPADTKLMEGLRNEMARKGEIAATSSDIRADPALPGVPGYQRGGQQAGTVPTIEPQRTPAAAQPAAPAAGDPVVEKIQRGEPLTDEEALGASSRVIAELGPEKGGQVMREYMRGIKRMGGAKSK